MAEHTRSKVDDALQVDVAKADAPASSLSPWLRPVVLCPRCQRESDEPRDPPTRTERVLFGRRPCKACRGLCDICAKPRWMWDGGSGYFPRSRCYDCEQLIEGGCLQYRACGRCSSTMIPLGYTLCAPCVREVEDTYWIRLMPYARRALDADPLPPEPLSAEAARRVRGLVTTLTRAEDDRKGLLVWVCGRLGEMIEAGELPWSDAHTIIDGAVAEAGLADEWAKLREAG